MSPTKPFVNPFDINDGWFDQLRHTRQAPRPVRRLDQVHESALIVDGVFAPDELAGLLEQLNRQSWVPVGVNGMLDGYRDGDQVGSCRASCFSEELAELLWKRMLPAIAILPRIPGWQPVGVNPLMRFIRYEGGGLLVPHYDWPYEHADGRVTRTTLVVYVEQSTGLSGGATRFVIDPQRDRDLPERRWDDWDRLASDEEILARIAPDPGSCLVFDHTLLHDSEPIRGTGRKTIMRTDLFHEPV